MASLVTWTSPSSVAAPAPSVAPKKKIVPNRRLPAVTPPQLTPVFDDEPTVEALVNARVFAEPMRPVGGVPTLQENRDLADALERTAAEGAARGMERLQRFVILHSTSPWRPSALANLGLLHARAGFFSRAAENWRDAWDAVKTRRDPQAKAVGSFAISEWLTQAASFGQTAVLRERLAEVAEFPLEGTAANRVATAREAYWSLTNAHDQAFFSGPEALKALAGDSGGLTERAAKVIAAYRAPHEGTSLTALADLSERAGMVLRARYYERPEEIPAGSVVHLRSQHFTAFVAKKEGGYLLRDLAFGGEMLMTEAAFRDEASGYALTSDPSDDGTRLVTDAEGNRVFGHCLSGGPKDDEPCPPCPPPGDPPPPGMPIYRLHPLTAAVMIYDRPLTYQPPRGAEVGLQLIYNHRTTRIGTASLAFGHTGPLWSSAWLSYVSDNNSTVIAPYSWLWRSEMAYSFHSLSRSIPHSIKRPLETRVWYRYPDQSAGDASSAGSGTAPTFVARLLVDGTTQVTQHTYNAQGMVTATTDPVGRQTVFVYASNGIDLLEVRQTKPGGYDTVASYGSYNAQHMPGTSTDAAGQTTTTTYNAAGQPLTVTNAKSETTTYAYNTDGQLETVTGPVSGAVTTYEYDELGRLRSVADADGYAVTTEYDALNRMIRRTYPDETFEEMTYARLDLVATRDRQGRITRQTYDRTGRVTSTRDPLGRVVRQEWCGCGSLEALVDAKGQRTAWTRDALGRVVTETRADGTTETTYTYDATGRLATVTDPKGQVTTHSYLADDRLSSTVYTNATIATPSVSFTYDAVYPRVATMGDGIGTTTYSYKAPGQLGRGRWRASTDRCRTISSPTPTTNSDGRRRGDRRCQQYRDVGV